MKHNSRLYRPSARLGSTAALIFVGVLAGCQTGELPRDPVLAQEGAALTPATGSSGLSPLGLVRPASLETQSVEFMDSGIFDDTLSDALRAGPRELKVKVASDTKLGTIPKRIDKWLYAVKKNGGSVKPVPIESREHLAQRGLGIGIVIEIAEFFYDKYSEWQTFAPAKNYNVEVRYFKDTGVVDSMVFIKRQG